MKSEGLSQRNQINLPKLQKSQIKVIVTEILKKATQKQKQRKRLRNLFSHFHQSGLPYSHLRRISKPL
jgi:hypothetical protein